MDDIKTIESIIEKYTGRNIDDIPDRFIDCQTLEIRKLIRFIQNSTIVQNNCEIHTGFRGELCPVCLMNELRQTQARLLHADKEIDRLKKLAESFKEQTRKALAEQYKLSVRITEFENERKAKVS
jgi:DNA repair exonuclease SbcCD ATPase subunit